MTAFDVITEHLEQEELLAQLAEEATELAHAALKLRRAYGQVNPTPVTARQAYEGLLEELADVQNCLTVLELNRPMVRMEVERTAWEKAERWAQRLLDAQEENYETTDN